MSMLKILTLTIICVACAPIQVQLPNGKSGYTTICATLSSCYQQAQKTCPRGYQKYDLITLKDKDSGSSIEMSFSCK